ncbi:MAG: cation diffusion facilitator family transporter [Coprobacillus sp.]|nr:cation diffusion facilitator family transporter [Coprobacillus sp.]MDY4145493.1 cation diffusion facilitator family transporter [Bacilli bacterium]
MSLIPRLFIKNYKDVDNPKVRFAYGRMCGVVGIISNFFLCALKIVFGLIIHSIAIIADGINNLADAGSSVITLIGFKLASLPSDKDHPFGHQRYEYITGLIVSVIIFFIGALLLKSSIEDLIAFEIKETTTKMSIITCIILFISVLVKCWQCLFYKHYGKLIKSTALVATGTDSLNDCITTIAILASVIVNMFYPNGYLDGIMGISVSIFILISGCKLIKETISPLIGEAPSKEFTDMVIKKILSYKGVLGVHDLVIHSYGEEKIFITAHVEVDSSESINVSHDMIDNIERDFSYMNLNLVIHMDPVDIHDEVVMNLKKVVSKIIDEIDPELKFHDFRIVKGITHTNVLFDIVVPNKYQLSNDEIKEEIDKKLLAYDDKLRTVITFDVSYIGGK